MRILVIGNPFDGLRLVGPFSDDDESAYDWAERFAKHEPWCVVSMESPLEETHDTL